VKQPYGNQGWATPEERRKFGRTRRKLAHRTELSHWSAKRRAHDPLALIRESMRGRLPQLVKLKYERMMASPFGYFRGAVPVMAADLAQLPHTGIITQICGDAHVQNLGAYASPDGRMIFDIDDFDETTRGPFEWDGRRMAASLVLAGREAGSKAGECKDAVRACMAQYRKSIRMFSEMAAIDVARYQVHRLQRIEPVSQALLKAARSTPQRTAEALTVDSKPHGHRIFREEKPLLVREHGTRAREITAALLRYRDSLQPEVQHLFDQYRVLDVAFKVVGTGSVGLRCYAIYLEGNGERDPLFLQMKEERPSAYAKYLPGHSAQRIKNEGQRVMEGQEAMQMDSDLMLGFTSMSGRDYLVRQLNDHKGPIDVRELAGGALVAYAMLCGELLARGHCRSGDACVLAGYMGSSAKMDEAIVGFADAYADQTEKDWKQLCKARPVAAVMARTARSENQDPG
jgi:uncharacterized protein (DUF2252 family)